MEQKDRCLESHTRDFLELACLTHYPDHSLCVFYITSLSEQSRARLPGSGPREDFAACVKWVLVNTNSAFTVSLAEPTSTPPPNAEPSQPTPRQTVLKPDSTADTEPALAAEKMPASPAEPCSAPEPESNIISDQVHESATTIVAEGVLVEFERIDASPAHTPAAACMCYHPCISCAPSISSALCVFRLPDQPPSSTSSILPTYFFSPYSSGSCLPLCSSTAVPVQHCGFAAGLPASPWREDPLSPPPATETWSPPQSFDPSALPWLNAPSAPPWPVIPPAPTGSNRLPRPINSALVRHHPGSTSGFQAAGCTSAFHLFRSTGLRLPSGSTGILGLCSGVPDLGLMSHQLRLGPPDPLCHPGSVSLRLHLVLIMAGFVTEVHTPGSIDLASSMAPPSCNAMPVRHADCGLGHHQAPSAPGSSPLHSPMD
ncbi:hypothetical protein PO909_015299 [Leuciscus waleckii]